MHPLSVEDQKQLAYFERSLTNLTPNAERIERIEELRGEAKSLAYTIIANTPPGRCRALALTNLETGVMYAVKAIVGVDDPQPLDAAVTT